jgi:hypothetical protein
MIIEYIKHEADGIEDELWGMLKSDFGLTRNKETLARIQATIKRNLNDEAQRSGLSEMVKDVDPNIEEIDGGMAWAFMFAASARAEENPQAALSYLLAAARAAAMIRTIAMMYFSNGLKPEEIKHEMKKLMGGVHSKNGLLGANKRHAPMRALTEWAIEKYKAGNWKSANQAAHDLKDAVVAHGRTINAHLSEENAQRTIAEWFRKSV